MKTQKIALFLCLVMVVTVSFSNNSFASIRQVRSYATTYTDWVSQSEREDMFFYLTASEADKFADEMRTGNPDSFLKFLGGFLKKIGNVITVQAFIDDSRMNSLAQKVDDAADDVGYGELLEVHLYSIYNFAFGIRTTYTDTKIVQRYPFSVPSLPYGHKLLDVEYIYNDF